MRIKKRKAQSVLEYGLVISAVIAALLVINIYLKKAVQGKLKESSDQIGRQFDPAKFTSSWKVESGGPTETVTKETHDSTTLGGTKTEIMSSETITRSEHETFGTAPEAHYK